MTFRYRSWSMSRSGWVRHPVGFLLFAGFRCRHDFGYGAFEGDLPDGVEVAPMPGVHLGQFVQVDEAVVGVPVDGIEPDGSGVRVGVAYDRYPPDD